MTTDQIKNIITSVLITEGLSEHGKVLVSVRLVDNCFQMRITRTDVSKQITMFVSTVEINYAIDPKAIIMNYVNSMISKLFGGVA